MIQFSPGVLEDNIRLLKMYIDTLPEGNRHALICYDEMKILCPTIVGQKNKLFSCDALHTMLNTILKPGKLAHPPARSNLV